MTSRRSPDPQVPDSTARARGGEPRALKVLIVDDDPLINASLEEILRMDGHAITTADGGQAGIDAFLCALRDAQPFEAVITDLRMPQVSGREVVCAIHAVAPQVPIMLLTGGTSGIGPDGDLLSQVTKVISKPPRLQELRAALAHAAANAR